MLSYKMSKRGLVQLFLFLVIFVLIADALRKLLKSRPQEGTNLPAHAQPVISSGLQHAQVFHDFQQDHTVLADYEHNQCLVAPLETALPPADQDLEKLYEKMKRGEYRPKQETMHVRYHVITPPLSYLDLFSDHVRHACKGMRYFLLETRSEKGIYGCDGTRTTWHTGTKVVHAHIVYCPPV